MSRRDPPTRKNPSSLVSEKIVLTYPARKFPLFMTIRRKDSHLPIQPVLHVLLFSPSFDFPTFWHLSTRDTLGITGFMGIPSVTDTEPSNHGLKHWLLPRTSLRWSQEFDVKVDPTCVRGVMGHTPLPCLSQSGITTMSRGLLRDLVGSGHYSVFPSGFWFLG